MKFKIIENNYNEGEFLYYNSEEYSFDMSPAVKEALFTITINYLNLIVGDDKKVVQIWGYCPYGSWIKSQYSEPKSIRGNLLVCSDLKPGFSYGLNSGSEWPVYENTNTGWICIGDPEKGNGSVEFIKNCVAVIEHEQIVSLWLKPIRTKVQ